MKKFLAIILTLAMLVAVLASCAGDTPEESSSKKDDFITDSESEGTGESEGAGESEGGNDSNSDESNSSSGEGGNNSTPSGLDGKSTAQLLLANERLNAQLLRDNDNIFVKGSEDLRNLANIARQSYAKYASALASISQREITPVDKLTTEDQSWVEVDGTTFKWGGFVEYSNSHSTFKDYSDSISRSAQLGADLIDNVKRYVRVVDAWIDCGMEMYLHVEENSETLYSRDKERTNIQMCTRYKNENGDNVYEIYIVSSSAGTKAYVRMLYIPGLRYEYSTKIITGDPNTNMDYCIVADNSKGYWEILNTNTNFRATQSTVSCMVIKDDICYDAFFSPESHRIGPMKIISADKLTDIMTVDDIGADVLSVELKLQGFSGYEYVELTTTEDKITTEYPYEGEKEIFALSENGVLCYQTTGYMPPVKIKLTNGSYITAGDKYLDDKVEIGPIRVSYQGKLSGSGYVCELVIRVREQGFEAQMATLCELLSLTGLECNRDMDTVKAGILRSFEEMEALSKYYTWNGASIGDLDAMLDSHAQEMSKLELIDERYNLIKNEKMISVDAREEIELNAHFGAVSVNAQGATESEGKITIEKIVITATDTLLFVEGEPYVIKLALLGEDGTLYHLDYEGATEAMYVKGTSFTLEQSGISIDIPMVSLLGKYKLVAYISTADGIRSSAPGVVNGTVTMSKSYNFDKTELNVFLDESQIAFDYKENNDVEITLTLDKRVSYAELYELMAQRAYEYGIVSDTTPLLVFVDSGDWQEVSLGDEVATENLYLLSFTRQIGTEVVPCDLLATLIYTEAPPQKDEEQSEEETEEQTKKPSEEQTEEQTEEESL